MSNKHSPFNWQGPPSVFVKDPVFSGVRTRVSERAAENATPTVYLRGDNVYLRGSDVYLRGSDVYLRGSDVYLRDENRQMRQAIARNKAARGGS